MAYKIQIEKFEGPLDLLLELIENEKMDITDVSLAKVTDQYLKHIENNENIDPSNLADFLFIAAKLIYIKSKSLLPSLEIDDEEEEGIEDLKARLAEYKRFKEASGKIKELYKSKYASYERPYSFGLKKVFYPGDKLKIDNILMAAQGLVTVLDKFEELKKDTIMETVSIKEKIGNIQSRLSDQVKLKFSKVIKDSESRVDAIVSFLALLELIKQKIVSVEQEGSFGEIEVLKSSENIN